jgi:hypothetical protein
MALRVAGVAFAVAVLTALAPPRPGAAAAPLVREAAIALPGVAGRIDHMALDPGRGRLLIAELGNDSLDVIDLAQAHVVHRITGLAEPQGVAFAPMADAIVVANGGDGSVRFFRAADFTRLGAIALGQDADDTALDPVSGNVVVGYGGGALAVIDPTRRAVAVRVAVAAHPEAFRLDPATARAFVNVPGAREIAVLDLHAARQVAAWHTPGLRANFPMALEPGGHVLATVFRAPPMLVLLSADGGATLAQQRTCDDADDVFFDGARHRLYVSCGAGAVDVFGQDGASLHRIARIATAQGARTSLFVPQLDRLFVAAPAPLVGGAAASILVFRPVP